MNKVDLSIIIPAYNCEKSIRKCVESIMKSGIEFRKKFEIIIVDDGSLDKTHSVCTALANLYEEIIVIKKENEGVSCARNVAIERANGKYLAFCDSDDEVEINYFSTIFPVLNSCNYDIISFGYSLYFESDNIKIDMVDNQDNFINDNFMSKMLSSDKVGGFVWNKIIKKEFTKNIRFNPELSICEDLSFLFEILLKNKELSIKYIKESLYIYINNELSASRNLSNLFDVDGGYKYEKTFNYILKSNAESQKYRRVFKSKLFECSLSTFLDNVLKNQLMDEHVSVLKKILKENFSYFIFNKEVSFKQKIKLIIFYAFPQIKKITNKS